MITEYVQALLERAQYKILPADGLYYGEIPEARGVYATAKSLEVCRQELREVLEEWLLLRISKGLSLPKVKGIDLKVRPVA